MVADITFYRPLYSIFRNIDRENIQLDSKSNQLKNFLIDDKKSLVSLKLLLWVVIFYLYHCEFSIKKRRSNNERRLAA